MGLLDYTHLNFNPRSGCRRKADDQRERRSQLPSAQRTGEHLDSCDAGSAPLECRTEHKHHKKKGGGEEQGKTRHLVARLGPLHFEGGDVAFRLAELHPDQVDGSAEVAVFFGIALVLDLGQRLAFRGVLQQLELE